MNKAESEKSRLKLLREIKRRLKKNDRAAAIAADTGYTAARIYQIKKAMVESGELKV